MDSGLGLPANAEDITFAIVQYIVFMEGDILKIGVVYFNDISSDFKYECTHAHRHTQIYVSRCTKDSLRAGRSGKRIPVGVRFSAPVQTSPGAHPASYTIGAGSFPG